MIKICSVCRIEKQIEEFSPNPAKRPGFRSVCKTCRVVQAKVYQALHPEVHSKANVKYREANREEIREQSKEYARHLYATEPERVKKAVQRYQRTEGGNLKNRETLMRKHVLQRYGKDLPALPIEVLKGVWKAYHNQCVYCGVTGVAMDFEHIEPLSLSGQHTPENLTLACGFCNKSKSNKILASWVVEKKFDLPAILKRIKEGRIYIAGIIALLPATK